MAIMAIMPTMPVMHDATSSHHRPFEPLRSLACIIGTASPYAALGLGASMDVHLVLIGLSGALAATFPLVSE